MRLTVTQSFVNIGLVFGVVAQRLERPPVTRKAAGSNPVNPAPLPSRPAVGVLPRKEEKMEKIKALLKKFRANEQTISMILGVLVVLVVGALVINYFRNTRTTKETQQPTSKETSSQEFAQQTIKLEELPTVYTVKAGDNLWKIAKTIYGSGYNWVDIAKENHLENPNLVYVGQELKIPKAEPIIPKISQPTKTLEPITGDTYTVVKGDNLWQIAVRAYGDGYQWVKIARENKLANPNLIHPGNIFKIPR
jgi:nucleoid-associated protein YgaU